MERIKILWLTRKGDCYVGAPSTFHGFEQEVTKYTESVFAGEGWSLHKPNESIVDTVKRVMPDCDWVIDDRNKWHRVPSTRKFRVGMMISDLHGKFSHGVRDANGFVKLLNRWGYDMIFMKYLEIHGTKAKSTIFLDNLKSKHRFLPWSIDPTYFKSNTKTIDACFIGAIGGKYPLRQDIYDNLKRVTKDYNVICATSPKGDTYDRATSSLSSGYFVGEKYANLLGDTHIMLFDSSIYRYPIQKYFESPASGALVLADCPSQSKELGFIDGETMVEVNRETWREKLLYYLENSNEAEKMVYQGYRNILKHHTHEIRAKEFIGMLHPS